MKDFAMFSAQHANNGCGSQVKSYHDQVKSSFIPVGRYILN